MSLLSQSCAEATRFLSDSYDSKLSLSARVGLRLHLAICRQCRRYNRHLHLLRSAFKKYPDNIPAEHLPEHSRRRIIEELVKPG